MARVARRYMKNKNTFKQEELKYYSNIVLRKSIHYEHEEVSFITEDGKHEACLPCISIGFENKSQGTTQFISYLTVNDLKALRKACRRAIKEL